MSYYIFIDLYPVECVCSLEIHLQTVKPNDVDLEKALKYLSGKDVRRSGRPKSKPKLEEAVEAV